MHKGVMGGIIVAVLLVIGIVVFTSQPDASSDMHVHEDGSLHEHDQTLTEESQAPPGPPSLDSQNTLTRQTREFSMTAERFTFNPAVITVNEGDTVILHITSVDVTHGFSLPAFAISRSLRPGTTVYIEFTADKKGEYPFFCNVACGSGHGSMEGKLVIV